MMNEQEMMKRIAELEEENGKLKSDIEKMSNRKVVESFAERFEKEYPWVAKQSVKTGISNLVRTVCFTPIRKTVHSNGVRNPPVETLYVLPMRNMTIEQANKYYEVCEKVIKLLDSYVIYDENIPVKQAKDTNNLEDLDLSVRAYNAIRRYGIETVKQLCDCTEDDLLMIRDLGIESLDNIKCELAKIGRSLKQEGEIW